MRRLITILLLLVTVSSYSQINTIKVSGVDTAAMLLPYKVNYPRQAISLVFTTTGTSGAATATYSNSTGVFTINIPQYSGGAGYTVNDSRIVFSANGVIKDTSTLVYDRTNGNVGIGLTTPLQKLDVDGQIKIGSGNVSQIYSRSDAGQLSIFSTSTPVKGAYILLNSANPAAFSDSGSALINYGDYTAVAPTNSLLRFRYATNGRAYDNLSANALGYVGINTNSAHNTLSVEPRRYNTGQASQSGSTVTGVGTTWTSDMVGDYFKWPSQTFPADRIVAVNSTTSLELALEQPIGNATVSDYEILRVGMQVGTAGTGSIGKSPTSTSYFSFAPATTALSSLNIPSGTAPSSPVNGDIWQASNHLYGRLNGVSYQLDQQSSGSGTVNSGTANRLGYYASTGTTISEAAAITASRAVASDANGLPVASTTTATELGYVNGVTSAIQTQLDAKQAALSGTGLLSLSGTTPSYNTTSSSIAGIIGDETGSGAMVFGTSPSFTTSIFNKKYIGGTSANDTLSIQGNNASSGNTATNANILFRTDNDGGRLALTLLNNGNGYFSNNVGIAAAKSLYWSTSSGINSNGAMTATSLNFLTFLFTGGYNFTGGNVGIGATTPNSTLHVSGSVATAYTATAVDLTLTSAHNVVVLTVTGKTGTLPTAVGITGRIYTIKLTASGTGTVATTSSQTIDGSTTYSLSAQYKYVTVQSDGANWNIIGQNDMKWFVLLVCLPTLLFRRKQFFQPFKQAA